MIPHLNLQLIAPYLTILPFVQLFLSCRCYHLIDMFVEFYKNHIFVTLLKRLNVAYPSIFTNFCINYYAHVPCGEKIAKNPSAYLNLLKIQRYTANMFYKQTCQSVCSNAVTSDDLIFRKLHIYKITVPYIRALHTQGSLSEARSHIGKRISEKESNFISCCGTIYMSTHYGKFLLVTSLLFLSKPNQKSALPIIIAESQSQNLIIGQF